jgi:hypothetical protein
MNGSDSTLVKYKNKLVNKNKNQLPKINKIKTNQSNIK